VLIVAKLLLLLLLHNYLLHLGRAFTIVYLDETMFLGYIVLQLFTIHIILFPIIHVLCCYIIDYFQKFVI